MSERQPLLMSRAGPEQPQVTVLPEPWCGEFIILSQSGKRTQIEGKNNPRPTHGPRQATRTEEGTKKKRHTGVWDGPQ